MVGLGTKHEAALDGAGIPLVRLWRSPVRETDRSGLLRGLEHSVWPFGAFIGALARADEKPLPQTIPLPPSYYEVTIKLQSENTFLLLL